MSDSLLAPRFHVVGTQLNAWRDQSGGTPSTIKSSSGTANAAVTSSSDTGVFGGSVIALASTTNIRAVRYPGQNNWSDVAAFSVLLRIVPRWTGVPSASEQGFFYASNPWNSVGTGVYLGMDTNGKPFMGFYDQYGIAYMPNTDWATAYSGFVAGTAVDLLFTWDGSASAGSTKFYVNGTLIASANPAAGSPSVNNLNVGSLVFGMCPNGGTLSNYDLNEAAVWDYALTSMDISNLSSRTTFLATTAFDGAANTDPGSSNVASGITYYSSGVLETGTATPSTDPGEGNVFKGVTYNINGVSKTGSGEASLSLGSDGRIIVSLG